MERSGTEKGLQYEGIDSELVAFELEMVDIYQICMVAERSHGKKGNEELDCVEVMGELESNGGGTVNLMDSEMMKAELMEGNEKLEKLWTEMELITELMKKVLTYLEGVI